MISPMAKRERSLLSLCRVRCTQGLGSERLPIWEKCVPKLPPLKFPIRSILSVRRFDSWSKNRKGQLECSINSVRVPGVGWRFSVP